MFENRVTSMRHVGMNRDDLREVVQSRLLIGQQYFLKSKHECIEKKSGFVRCKLVLFSKNAAVFEHKNGTKESFTYQEIYSALIEGEIK